ncbi:hypothetical protein [Nostoc sp.]
MKFNPKDARGLANATLSSIQNPKSKIQNPKSKIELPHAPCPMP